MSIILETLLFRIWVVTLLTKSLIAKPALGWAELQGAPIGTLAGWSSAPSTSYLEGAHSHFFGQGGATDFVPMFNQVPPLSHESRHPESCRQHQLNHLQLGLHHAQLEQHGGRLAQDDPSSSLVETTHDSMPYSYQAVGELYPVVPTPNSLHNTGQSEIHPSTPNNSQDQGHKLPPAMQVNSGRKRGPVDTPTRQRDRKYRKISTATVTVPPGGDLTFWFWGLSGRPTIQMKNGYQIGHFVTATRRFWRSLSVSKFYKPTNAEDILKGVPVRFVTTGFSTTDPEKHQGCIRIMKSDIQVLSLHLIARHLRRLLTWTWHYHAALLDRLQIKKQEVAQQKLFDWLWKMFHEPGDSSLPVLGLTTRAKFDAPVEDNVAKFGIAQRWLIAYLAHPEPELIMDTTAHHLIFTWYCSKNSWDTFRFHAEKDFWHNALQAVPPYLKKHMNKQARLKWSPAWKAALIKKADRLKKSGRKNKSAQGKDLGRRKETAHENNIAEISEVQNVVWI